MADFSPYQESANCGHRSSLPEEKTLFDGSKVGPFRLGIGDDKKWDPVPLELFGEVSQEIIWEGLDVDGHQVAELQVVRFYMIADHPQLGHLVITHDATRPGQRAFLRAVKAGNKFPAIHTSSLHVVASASKFPGVLLQNQGPPLQFVSELLEEWPPKERIYRLPVDVPFAPRPTPADRQEKGVSIRPLIRASAGGVVVSSLVHMSGVNPEERDEPLAVAIQQLSDALDALKAAARIGK